MNKVILMGRLTRNPELTYSQSSKPIAITRYSLAVNRSYKREGEPDADFLNIVTFGKRAEFASKYFKKGQMISVVGEIRVRNWTDDSGTKRWTTEIIASEQHFAESRASYQARSEEATHQSNTPMEKQNNESGTGFYPINEDLDDDLPF